MKENLKVTALASKASRTSATYLGAFNRWKSFATNVLGILELPVVPIDCALYLHNQLESTKSVSAINCAYYAFKWVHSLAGVDSPTSHPAVITVKEGAVPLSSHPAANRKEPLEVSHLKLLAKGSNMEDLLQLLTDLVMFVLAFSGFAGNPGFAGINIEKSKTNQLREGRSVVITQSGSSTSPWSLLKL